MIRRGNDNQKYNPIPDGMRAIKNQKKCSEFEEEHCTELILFQIARRELSEFLTGGEKINIDKWEKEKRTLEKTRMRPLVRNGSTVLINRITVTL